MQPTHFIYLGVLVALGGCVPIVFGVTLVSTATSLVGGVLVAHGVTQRRRARQAA